MAQLMRDLLQKLFRYGVTGGIAAVIDATGFMLLINAKFNIVAASCPSFFIAALVNYNLSSRFVFHRKATLRGFAAFLAAAMVGLMVNIAITYMGVSAIGLPPLAAKVMGIAVAFIVNFLVNLRVVFRLPPEQASEGT